MRRKLTLEEIKEKLKEINSNIEIMSDKYIDSRSKLKCRCLIDNNIWEITWDKLSQKRGCPKCANLIKGSYKKLNIKEIKKRLSVINPNVKILSNEYINARTKLKCMCLIDGHKWEATWNSLCSGHGCPVCQIRNIKDNLSFTLQEVKEKIKIINPNIEILSNKYFNNKIPLKCKCLIDGYEWFAKYSHLQEGHGCPSCKIRNISGRSHHNWNGGISQLRFYLRRHISPWRQDSMKSCEYKCVITGGKFEDIHHLVGFDQILQETLEVTSLPLYQEINKYTDSELKLLSDTCLKLHYKYGMGACLTEEMHKEFHSIYGYGNNTIEQFEEFEEMKLKQLYKSNNSAS